MTIAIEIPPSLAGHLRGAGHVVALTGAGISAESGVPTFRDAQTGLWARYRPEELATPEAFMRDPRMVWEWYAWRRALVAKAAPNAGHLALVELEQRVPRFTLIRTYFMYRHVCDGGDVGCSSRRRARRNMSIFRGSPTQKCAQIAPSLRVAARTVGCIVALLDHIDIWPSSGALHPVRPGHNASRAYT